MGIGTTDSSAEPEPEKETTNETADSSAEPEKESSNETTDEKEKEERKAFRVRIHYITEKCLPEFRSLFYLSFSKADLLASGDRLRGYLNHSRLSTLGERFRS